MLFHRTLLEEGRIIRLHFKNLAMKKGISRELIQKYLNGTCSVEEAGLIYEWYDSFEEEADPLLQLSGEEREELRKRLLDHIRENIAIQGNEIARRPSGRRTVKVLWYALSGAAAILLLIAGNFFLNRKVPSPLPAGPEPEEIVVTNMTKSIHKIVLSDSSLVWLSPDSRLKYPERFKGQAREVKMYGEAFFEVAKDRVHPFIIYAGGVITKVLGTSFMVKAFRDAPTEVSVVTGKVSVKIPDNDHSEIMLLPHQIVTYFQKESRLQKKQIADSTELNIWEKVNLSFDNTPVKEVVAALNKKFNVQIEVQDEPIDNYLLNGDFTGQNLPDILEMIEKSLNVSYEIRDNKIILKRE